MNNFNNRWVYKSLMDRWDKREKELTDRVSGHASLMKKTTTFFNYSCQDCDELVIDTKDKRVGSYLALRHEMESGHSVSVHEYETGDPCNH